MTPTTRGPEDRRDEWGQAGADPEETGAVGDIGAVGDTGDADGAADKTGPATDRNTTGKGRPRKADKNDSVTQPALGVFGMLRWAWRQLTTMRIALMLLLLLALAAIPGSLFPQRIQDPAKVTQYIADNGKVAEWMDKVQLFDVYSSAWFSAIYILLLVSLVGCILPRAKVHWAAMRANPPKAPRRMTRMPAFESFGARGQSAFGVLDAAESALKSRRYRTNRAGDHIAAERGYLRETGNLLFHVAVVGVVVSMAIGSLFGYSGQKILVEGDTFTNSLVSYDSFNKGTYFSPSRLADYSVRLDKFSATFDTQAQGNQFGQPRSFRADTTTRHNGETEKQVLQVNHPLEVGAARLYLTGNGYAPVLTVRDSQGTVVFSGPTVFLPQTGAYMSRGVVKVPDAEPDQLGFVGIFFPTAGEGKDGQVDSTFAGLVNPYLVLSAYAGDLGIDGGDPQSVYSLDPSKMKELTDTTGKPAALQLQLGKTVQLPDGQGSVSLDDVKRYVSLDVRSDPGQGFVLVFALLALLGLATSLFVPRRRIWVKVAGTSAAGDPLVEVAGLARGEDNRLQIETRQIAAAVRKALGLTAGDGENGQPAGDGDGDAVVSEERSVSGDPADSSSPAAPGDSEVHRTTATHHEPARSTTETGEESDSPAGDSATKEK